jgi:hypothetical protein
LAMLDAMTAIIEGNEKRSIAVKLSATAIG